MDIAITIIVALALVAGIYFLVRLVKIERIREKEDYLLATGSTINFKLFKRFINRKAKAKRRGSMFTVTLVSLNNFEHIEDTYGKVDAVNILRKVQEHIKDILPSMSVVADGLETGTILIYLPKVFQDNEMRALANKIKSAVEIKIKVFEDIYVTNSSTISYVVFPLNGKTFESLFGNLNLAIYLGEKSGGDTIISYSNEMQKDKEFIDFYYEIKDAIRKKEFVLYYHPIIDVKKNEILGFESLIRWNHPQLGILPPKDFLTKLESSGDLDWVGFWSLDNIARFSFKAVKTNQKPFDWHLNISHQQLLNAEIVDVFHKTISRYRIDPYSIVLEIVDFEKILNHTMALKTMIKLSNIGFRTAVSIKEVNYQLLANIEKYDVDVIKLDSNVLKKIDNVINRNFVDTIIELLRKNRVTVIIEAVEDEKSSEFASKNKFYVQQGYLFTEPISEQKVTDFIRKF
ncbi:MAG: EAL domain-containing protein [Acholeplasmataceae bacterium]|jgi:EAL domain-containing protein (putative c-di-GMP-specific phosphodiesterase class I)/GGDEF domain-containing protein|nr:EAL domain-containing protein [Acholeplasmataceae bacterium]